MMMNDNDRPDRYRVLASLGVCLVMTAAVVGPSGPVSAASLTYFAGGQAYSLERSETELAIEFIGADTPGAADARFRTLGLGWVEPLSWGPAQGRFAILHVAGVDARTRTRVLAEGLVRSVRRVYRFNPEGLPHLGSGRVVVKFAEGVGPEAAAGVVAEYGARWVRPLGSLERIYVVEPQEADIDEVELAARMHGDARIVFADPDLIAPLLKTQFGGGDFLGGALSSEPFAKDQWHLENTGQEGGVIGADINVAEAFADGAFGAGQVIGMLDDACDVLHEDLLSNYINASHDALTGTVSASAANPVSSSERHGTAMMGLICAAVNSNGVVGVAPAARFTASRGADEGLSASAIASAFSFALERGVGVHCNSWAGEAGAPSPDTVRDAVEEAFTTGRADLGMVVVFPTGNDGQELEPDSALAGLTNEAAKKLVIGVGACNASELVASYSSYGMGVVDVLAPSGDVFLPQIVTTDNTDATFPESPGYNHGGLDDFGQANLPDSQYTRGDSFSDVTDPDFFGTSAASAQVAGVAALVLGATGGAQLTATQVRAVLEHTTSQIPLTNPQQGGYNKITGRSLKYGYGRVNAGKAVTAARLVTINNPYTWPERVKNVAVAETETGKVLNWEKNDDLRVTETGVWGDATISVLVVQRIGLDFEWVPTDQESYFAGETVDFIQNVTVAQVGDNTSYAFSDSLGIVYFGIFARNAAGRYSFGFSIDSEGRIVETGRSTNLGQADGNANNNSSNPTRVVPTVSIAVAPLSGLSSLTVSFRGNAPESDSPIVSATWDFGDGSPPVHQSIAEHTYTLPGNTTQTYTATFTVVDADGDEGSRSVVITVLPPEGTEQDGSAGAIRIIISAAGQMPTDIGDLSAVGTRLELTVDTTRIVGTPQSIFWNLGDGAIADSFIVSHTYDLTGTFPIFASVTARTSSGDPLTFTASRLFTVLESATPNANGNGNANSPQPSGGGGGTGGVCGVGMAVPLLALLGLAVLRKLRFTTA